jgi:hypothetical protein
MIHDPHKAIDYILQNSRKYAEAKAKRVYLEEFRKSKKAILMTESTEQTAVAREQYAYSHPDYLAVLAGIKAAVEVEEKLRWEIIAAQARIEVWRTEQANNRYLDKATA